jgi:hypothetical protein
MQAFIIVFSLIPMIITIGATKRFIAVMSGLSLVVLGALGPFLQVSNFSMFLLLASSGKIFLQNFLIGILAGFILGCPSQLEESGTTVIEYVRPKLKKGLSNTTEFFTKPFKDSDDIQTEDKKNPKPKLKEASKDNSDESPAENSKPSTENTNEISPESPESGTPTDTTDTQEIPSDESPENSQEISAPDNS